VPEEYLKHLEGTAGLYEKTPKAEIEKALKIKKEYETEK
jgi:hypothetical protein